MSPEEFTNLKASIRAVLLSLGRTATEQEFRREFNEMESRKFYEVLEDLNMTFLQLFSIIPDVATISFAYGQILIHRVSNEETSHMDQLTINKFSKNYRGPLLQTNYGLMKAPVRPLRVEALPYSYFPVRPPQIYNNYYPGFYQPNVSAEFLGFLLNNPAVGNSQFLHGNENNSRYRPTEMTYQSEAPPAYSYNSDGPSTSSGNNQYNISASTTSETSSFENSYSVGHPLTSSPRAKNRTTQDVDFIITNEISSDLTDEDNKSTASIESEKAQSDTTCSTAYVTSPNRNVIVEKEEPKVTPAKPKPAASSTNLKFHLNILNDENNSGIAPGCSKGINQKTVNVIPEEMNNKNGLHNKENENTNLKILKSDVDRNRQKTIDLLRNIMTENNAKDKMKLQKKITNHDDTTKTSNQNEANSSNFQIFNPELAKDRMQSLRLMQHIMTESKAGDKMKLHGEVINENIVEIPNQSNGENTCNLQILNSELDRNRPNTTNLIKNLIESEAKENNKKVSNAPVFSKVMNPLVELPPIVFDENNRLLEIKILDVLSLTNFTFQFSLDKLAELDEKLNQFYNHLQNIDNYRVDKVFMDYIVAVRYDNSWYRAQITSADESEVYVKFIDYLKIAPVCVSHNDIFHLHQEFTTESPKSATGRIHGLKPNIEVDWNIIGDYKLIENEGEKVLVIYKSVNDDIFALSITMEMGKFKRMIDALLEDGLAEINPNDFNEELFCQI